MSTIDERIVSMRFDNREFEQGVSTTIRSVEKLKQGMRFEESARSLANLQNESNRFNLNGLGEATNGIGQKFNAMSIIAITALVNIANKAVNVGIRMTKALTIEPVLTGLKEYETKMTAIQTILTNTKSKGTTIDQVTEKLDELNRYADLTIYNFAEMTRNIGTFTAAGVGLEDATTAIKGIANLGAGSGSTVHQVNTAMYQLSQALASGKVMLQDWRSVENAGMGGEYFKNALYETAEAMGIFVDRSIPFRESISGVNSKNSWLTSEVLINTLKKFADDETLTKAATQVKTITQLWDTLKESAQSGWAMSWELVVGNLDEASKVLTAVKDVFDKIIGSSADARNEMLRFWKDNGGRQAMIDGLANAFKALQAVLIPIGTAFRNIFPRTTGQQLIEMSERFRDFTAKLVISGDTAKKIQTIFEAVFKVIRIFVDSAVGFGTMIFHTIMALSPLAEVIFNNSFRLSELVNKIADAITEFDIFKRAGDGVVGVLRYLANAAAEVAKKFDFISVIETGAKAISTFAGKIKDGFRAIFDQLDFGDTGFGFNKVIDVINSGLFGVILWNLNQFANNLNSPFALIHDIFANSDEIMGSFNNILIETQNTLKTFQGSIKAKTLMTIAKAVGILALSIGLLSILDPDKVTTALVAISAAMGELFLFMTAFQKYITIESLKGMGTVNLSLIALATAILILAGAMHKLGQLDLAGIGKGLIGVTGGITALVGAVWLMNKGQVTMVKGTGALLSLAGAVVILAYGVEKLAKVPFTSLVKGLGAMGVILAELGAFLTFTDFSGLGIFKGGSIVLMATGLRVLTGAVEKLSSINSTSLAKAVLAIGGILTEIAGFSYLMGNSTHLITSAVALNIVALSFGTLSKAILSFGSSSWEAIAKGLVALGGALTEIGTAVYFMPATLPIIGVGLIAVASALKTLSESLLISSSMSWEGIAKGLIVMAGSLTIIATAMQFMTTALPGAAALLVISVSLKAIGSVVESMSSLSWEGIAKGLIVVGGAFGVIAGAAYLIAPIVPSMLALAGGVAALGVACLAAGAGIAAFGLGFSMLANLGASGGKAILDFLLAMVDSVDKLVKIFTNIGMSILKAIENLLPKIVDVTVKIVMAVLDAIVQNFPAIIDKVIFFLMMLLDAIDVYSPMLVDKAITMIINFINAIAEGLRTNVPYLVDALKNLFGAIVESLITILQGVVEVIPFVGKDISSEMEKVKTSIRDAVKPSEMKKYGEDAANGWSAGFMSPIKTYRENGTVLGKEAKTGIQEGAAGIDILGTQTSTEFIQGFLKNQDLSNMSGEALTKELMLGMNKNKDEYSKIGDKASSDFVKKINESAPKANEAGKKIGTETEKGIKANETTYGLLATKYGTDFTVGIESKSGEANLAGRKLSESAKSGLGDVRGGFRQQGENAGEGFAAGIRARAQEAKDEARRMAQEAINSVKRALNAHSPSREFIKLGEWSGEGYVIGLQETYSSVERASDTLGSKAIESVKKIFYRYDPEINDIKPKIKPVIDLSEVDKLHSQIEEKTITPQINKTETISIEAKSSLDRQIIKELSGLRQDMYSLYSGFQNLKMVVDSRVLVGELIPEIDMQLGIRSAMTERGV